MSTYIMTPVPSILKSELSEYIKYRTSTFAARRQGGAVQSISAEADKTSLLRFFGYMQRTNRIPADQPLLFLAFLLRADLGDLVQAYASWLQNTQRLKFSSIANYLNGLVSLVSYAYANLEVSDAVLNSDPNPLAQIINLRSQAEKASKTQAMYTKRVGGWLTWEDVQKARKKCLETLDESLWGTPGEKRFALRDAAAISLLSLIPPDRCTAKRLEPTSTLLLTRGFEPPVRRVGCIRKLRLGHTLKKKDGGGWKMDLSKQRDGHKTSRFCAGRGLDPIGPLPSPTNHPTDRPPAQTAPSPPRSPTRSRRSSTGTRRCLSSSRAAMQDRTSSTRRSRTSTGRWSRARGPGGCAASSSGTTARRSRRRRCAPVRAVATPRIAPALAHRACAFESLA